MNFKKFLGFFWETAKLVLISLVIIIPIRYYVVQPFFVLGSSMEPNFQNGDYLIINEISYKFDPPQRGDVIVFKYPYDTKEFYIKRVVGLPGEIVEFHDGKVMIKNKDNPDGFYVDEKYLPGTYDTTGGSPVTLGNDEYFVMGDNRPASSDSRRWGPLKDSFIVGKVALRIFPFDTIKMFQ